MGFPILSVNAISVFLPLQTIYLAIGGSLVVTGLFMTGVKGNDKWQQRGISVFLSGLLILFPAVIPMVITSWFIQDMLPIMYLLTPLVSIVVWHYWNKSWFKEIEPN